jgi:threonine dehydratase
MNFAHGGGQRTARPTTTTDIHRPSSKAHDNYFLIYRPVTSTPTLNDIRAAQERIKPHIHRTPVLTSAVLDKDCGGHLFFKCENFQKVGAFKARGATNAVFSLSEDEARRGVATHSSGNHAAALSRAAGLRGIPAHIVMPNNASAVKQAAVRRYGGHIVLCEPTVSARETACARVLTETGATLVHSYNDPRVIAGQGTAALELHEQAGEMDVFLSPVGGGGLLSGLSIALRGLQPGIQIFGTEPEQADDAARSLHAGHIVTTTANTIADGLRTSLGDLGFSIIRQNVNDIVTVSEAGIIAAMRRIWEVLKIVIEPSSAVPYAAIMEGKVNPNGRRIGIILTGGNVDLDKLPWVQAVR